MVSTLVVESSIFCRNLNGSDFDPKKSKFVNFGPKMAQNNDLSAKIFLALVYSRISPLKSQRMEYSRIGPWASNSRIGPWAFAWGGLICGVIRYHYDLVEQNGHEDLSVELPYLHLMYHYPCV